MVKNLPEVAQKRVKALKNLQLDFLKHECEFFAEVYQLERKYQEKYQTIADKRKKIINGDYEPTDSESQFKSDDEEEDSDDAMIQERLKSMKSLPQFDANVKGMYMCEARCDLVSPFKSIFYFNITTTTTTNRNSRILVNHFP